MNKTVIFIFVLLLLLFVEQLLRTFFAIHFHYNTPRLLLGCIYALVIVSIFTGKKSKAVKTLLLAGISLLLLLPDKISDRMFVGGQMAYAQVAEAPGSCELYLYRDHMGKVCFNGPFGTDKQFYVAYTIMGDSIVVQSPAGLVELEGRFIDLDGKSYVIASGR